MKWFLRALVYAMLLVAPGIWIAPAYQSLLLACTGAIIGATLVVPPDGAVDLSASNMLTIFVAMCLASGFASWRRRVVSIALGIVVLVAIEVLTGVVGIRLAAQSSHAVPSRWDEALQHALELSRWLAVPMTWGILLGRATQQDAPGKPPSVKPTRSQPSAS